MTDLIHCSAVELAGRIGRGDLSAREVVSTFIGQIESINPQLNAVVSTRFEEAIREAQLADERAQQGGELGPLHGVPITIKENFYFEETPTTLGLTTQHEPRHENHVLVQRLVDAGAIVVGKTNIPQMMLWHESDNPLYGRTNHPLDAARTCGGSSGGETAIVAAQGSPLGLGSDIGGSIRIPAHFCGIHGIKPTNHRLTSKGSRKNLRGLPGLISQCGPMSRSVDDLILAMKLLANGQAEPSGAVPPIPFKPITGNQIGRVAFWEDDGYFRPSPGIRRAVREAASALQHVGWETIDARPDGLEEITRIYLRIISSDGGADAKRLLKGSRVDWRLKRLLLVAAIPQLVRSPLTWLLRNIGQPYTADLLSCACPKSSDALWQLLWQLQNHTERFIAWMDGLGIDAVLCPPHGLVAMPHEAAIDLVAPSSYAFLANVLGVPAGVVAATSVRDNEESDRSTSRDWVLRRAGESEKSSAGLPIGVQVIGRHWREDIVLNVMKQIENALGDRSDYPIKQSKQLQNSGEVHG